MIMTRVTMLLVTMDDRNHQRVMVDAIRHVTMTTSRDTAPSIEQYQVLH